MRIMKKASVLLAAAVMITAVGCGGATGAAQSEEPAKESTMAESTDAIAEDIVDETEGNPAKQYAGAYVDKNGSEYYLLIEAADATDGVSITVVDPNGETYVYWDIYGKIKENTITYSQAGKYSLSYEATEEEEAPEELIYDDGSGTFEISADKTVVWKDDKEDAGKDILFIWDEEMNQSIQEQMDSTDADFIDDSQNPLVNWAGPYVDENNKDLTMEIMSGSEEEQNCGIFITKDTDVNKSTVWSMSGDFNEQTMTIEFKDCVKKEVTYDNDGNQVSEETIYENGTGKLEIDEEEQTIHWVDDKEDAGKDSSFIFNFDYGDYSGDTGELAEDFEEFEEYEDYDNFEDFEDVEGE